MAKNIECKDGVPVFKTNLHPTDTDVIANLKNAVNNHCRLVCMRNCRAKTDLARVQRGVREMIQTEAQWAVDAIDGSKNT